MNEDFNKIRDQNKTKRNDEHNNNINKNDIKNQTNLIGKAPDNKNKKKTKKNSFLSTFI